MARVRRAVRSARLVPKALRDDARSPGSGPSSCVRGRRGHRVPCLFRSRRYCHGRGDAAGRRSTYCRSLATRKTAGRGHRLCCERRRPSRDDGAVQRDPGRRTDWSHGVWACAGIDQGRNSCGGGISVRLPATARGSAANACRRYLFACSHHTRAPHRNAQGSRPGHESCTPGGAGSSRASSYSAARTPRNATVHEIAGVDAGKLRASFAAAFAEEPSERPSTASEFVASFQDAVSNRRVTDEPAPSVVAAPFVSDEPEFSARSARIHLPLPCWT